MVYYLDEDRIRHVLESGEYAIVSPIIYYYHSDHLGGASWITDNNGEPIQYIHYMPYGELWRNQRNSTYDERYKFTGKERDAEIGGLFLHPVILNGVQMITNGTAQLSV